MGAFRTADDGIGDGTPLVGLVILGGRIEFERNGRTLFSVKPFRAKLQRRLYNIYLNCVVNDKTMKNVISFILEIFRSYLELSKFKP